MTASASSRGATASERIFAFSFMEGIVMSVEVVPAGVSLLAYSPLGFGTLTGKYDTGLSDQGRIALFESVRKQRWGRPETFAAARLYNELAVAHGLTPTQMALAFCYTNWRVASTIIGVTTRAQLDENIDAWGTSLSPELLAKIDAIRWTHRDPAQ